MSVARKTDCNVKKFPFEQMMLITANDENKFKHRLRAKLDMSK